MSDNSRDPWSGSNSGRDPWDMPDKSKNQPKESRQSERREPVQPPQQPQPRQPSKREQAKWQQYRQDGYQQASRSVPQGGYTPQGNYVPQGNGQPTPLVYPMNWHKFLIYFGLWMVAIVNILPAIGLFSGIIDVSASAYIYLGGLYIAPAEIISATTSLAVGVLALVARFALAKYRRSGPKLLVATYTVALIGNLLYFILSNLIIGVVPSSGGVLGNIAGPALFLWANKTYYKKRAFMFVN